MAGTPRKSIAQKKLEGTYRRDRDGEREKAEAKLAESRVVFPSGTRVSCPKSIRTKHGRSFWRKEVEMLVRLQVLAPADLPQVEQLCVLLEKIEEAREAFARAAPLDDDYAHLRDSYLKLSRQFNALGEKYYISPAARSRLALDALNAEKAASELHSDDAIDALLAMRR